MRKAIDLYSNIDSMLPNMKCEICRKEIETTFMNKILGTHVKDDKGKKHVVCFECQKKFLTKKEILENIK